MTTNKELYQLNIDQYSNEKSHLKSISILYTLARLALFIGIVFFIVLSVKFEDNKIWLYSIFLSALTLAFVIKKDAKHILHCKLVDQLLSINKNELAYLNEQVDQFDNGLEFLNPENPFTADLDIFGEYSVFQAINRTGTSAGRHKLAHWLSISQLDAKQIVERQEAVMELKEELLFRQTFQATGQMEKDNLNNLTQIANWIMNKKGVVNKKSLLILIYISPFLTIGSILLSIFTPYVSASIPEFFCLLMLIVTGIYLKTLNKVHQEVEQLNNAFSKYANLLNLVKNQKFNSPKLFALYKDLFGENHNSALAIKQLSKIIGAFDQRANLFVAIVFNALYLRDLQLLIRLEKWKSAYDIYIEKWINASTEIDAIISLSNFSFNHSEFIFPTISTNKVLKTIGLGHPLIHESVRINNDFELDQLSNFKIVTGANMAGKSTFLRAVGVNILLASCGAPVCAKSFEFKPMTLFTSMRTTDNLSKHTSYFHAELLRLKLLIDKAEKGIELFVILDEILKGTNSTDKLIGSRRFLTKLKDLPIAGIVATHDLALGDLSVEFENQFENICFEVEIEDKNIVFDYKLKNGVSKNMNATVLMEQMGIV